MGLINFAYLVFLWVVPILIIWRSYRKLGEAKRREFIKELKDPLTIFGIAPASIGLLLIFTSSVPATGLQVLRHLGIGFIFFGWLVVWVTKLVKREGNVAKSIAMIIIGVFVLIAYIYMW